MTESVRRFYFLLLLAFAALLLMPGNGAAQGSAELLQKAKQLEDQQNYPAAEDLYRKILASDPDNPEALKQMGLLEQTNLQLDRSIEHFKRVLADAPDYPQVNFFLGLSYNSKRSELRWSYGVPPTSSRRRQPQERWLQAVWSSLDGTAL